MSLADASTNPRWDWVALYGPAIYGGAMMVAVLLDTWNYVPDLPSGFLLLLTAAFLCVLALQRAHEYQHGFSLHTPRWPSAAYSLGIVGLMAAINTSSILLAILSGAMLVGTAYYTKS